MEPTDDLRLLDRPPRPRCDSGLPVGEYGEGDAAAARPCKAGLPRPDKGELVKLGLLPTEPAKEGEREYRGGVLNFASAVAGEGEGGRPKSLRWTSVRGISLRSS